MDSSGPVEQDAQVQQSDAELDRLVARIDALRTELGQAEHDLRELQTKNMQARRAAITGSPVPEQPPVE